jgi:hypothetical protein
MTVLLASILGFFTHSLFAFPPGGVDTTTSMGRFTIRLSLTMGRELLGIEGCPTAPGCRIDSPVLFDGNTRIGRSNPFYENSKTDIMGAVIPIFGNIDINLGAVDTVKDSDFVWPTHPPFVEDTLGVAPGTEEVHTQILSLYMIHIPPCGGESSRNAIRAGGVSSYWRPRSVGEVESLNTPPGNFPAESFFDIFAEVDVDLPPYGNVDMTVFNRSPLIVQAEALYSFPPRVIYTHGGSDYAPAVFDTATGRHVGWITMAGHSVGMACDDQTIIDSFKATYANFEEQMKLEYVKEETLVDTSSEPVSISDPLIPPCLVDPGCVEKLAQLGARVNLKPKQHSQLPIECKKTPIPAQCYVMAGFITLPKSAYIYTNAEGKTVWDTVKELLTSYKAPVEDEYGEPTTSPTPLFPVPADIPDPSDVSTSHEEIVNLLETDNVNDLHMWYDGPIVIYIYLHTKQDVWVRVSAEEAAWMLIQALKEVVAIEIHDVNMVNVN